MLSSNEGVSAGPVPRGRRPGDSGAREAILASARATFSQRGFDRATIRAIAGVAGVDPGLVMHYFGSKRELFVQAMRPPFELSQVLPGIIEGDPEMVGRRLAAFAVGAWEAPESRAGLLGILRATTTDPSAAAMMRRLIEDEFFAPIAEAVGRPPAMLRAALVSSQIVGMAMARYVIGVEPLASAAPGDLVDWLAPTLQRYLTGPLESDAPPGPKEET